MQIVSNSQVIVQSKEIVCILHALGWTDFRFYRPRAKRARNKDLRVNGLCWPVARKIILIEARLNGIEFSLGQLRDVAYLLAAGYFVQGGD